MAYADDASRKLDDATSQIARLREQVETLMKERVTPAVADMAGRAESAVYGATGAVREQADALSGRVKEQPLTAILVALGIGFILGRASR